MRTLLSPAAAPIDIAAGGTAGGAPELPPNSLANWITGLGPVETDATKTDDNLKEKEDTDGKNDTNGRPAGDVRPEPGAVGNAPDAASAAATKAKQEAAAKAAQEAKDKVSKEPKADDTKSKDDDDAEKWPRSSADWDKFKTKRKERETALKTEISTREAAIKELQEKVSTYEAKASEAGAVDPEIKTNLERLEAENKEMSDKLTVLEVREHPKFVKYFDKKYSRVIGDAKTIVGQDRADAIEKILKISDPEFKQAQFNAFISETEDENVRVDLRLIMREMRAVDDEKKEAIESAAEQKAKISVDQTAKAAGVRQTFEQTFVKVQKALQDPKVGSALFQKRDGDEVWNKGVDARIKEAESILLGTGQTPESVVRTAFHAAAYKPLLEGYRQAHEQWQAEKAKFEQQIKDLSAANPGGRGSGPKPADTDGKVEIKQDMNPFEASRAWAKSMTQGANGE